VAPSGRARASRSPIRDYVLALILAVLCATFVSTFLVQTFKIPSPSMEPALLVGDHILVNRFVYGGLGDGPPPSFLPMRAPERGDVVIFRWPEDPGQSVVKRCVGLPGEVFEVDGFGPAPVPAGHYFLLGDHRDDSSDSRQRGSVAADRVRGRALIVLWSFEMPRDPREWGMIDRVFGWFGRSRWDRCLIFVR